MQEQNASSPLLTEIVSDITITVQMILALLEGIIMKVDLAALNAFPDIMNKEQMRIACHISKRTALFLLQYNLIPNETSGKKTRCYRIKKSDVISFILDREINPEKYIAPQDWYRYGNKVVKPYKIRIVPDVSIDDPRFRAYYEKKLNSLPDVFDVPTAAAFTGYNNRTVHSWIRCNKLKALSVRYKYMIPKSYFLDWVCSEEYNATNRKSKAHINMLWEISDSFKDPPERSKRNRTGNRRKD